MIRGLGGAPREAIFLKITCLNWWTYEGISGGRFCTECDVIMGWIKCREEYPHGDK